MDFSVWPGWKILCTLGLETGKLCLFLDRDTQSLTSILIHRWLKRSHALLEVLHSVPPLRLVKSFSSWHWWSWSVHKFLCTPAWKLTRPKHSYAGLKHTGTTFGNVTVTPSHTLKPNYLKEEQLEGCRTPWGKSQDYTRLPLVPSSFLKHSSARSAIQTPSLHSESQRRAVTVQTVRVWCLTNQLRLLNVEVSVSNSFWPYRVEEFLRYP